MEEASQEDLKGMHNIHQAAQITGKSHWWLRKLARRGSLGFVRVGRQRRLMFPASELLRLLANQKSK